MELFDTIFPRRSYRGKYLPDPVPREDLRKILEATLAAPSGCNKQTTSAIAVDDPELIRQFGELMEAPNFGSAPAGICILTEKKIAYRDRTYYIQDYSAAIENALLAICALGYESCWVEGHITDADRIGRRMADLLGVPVRMIVSPKGLKGGTIEVSTRDKSMQERKPVEEAVDFVYNYVVDELGKLECRL